MKVWEDENLDILERICAWEDGDTNRELTGMDWYRVAVDLMRDAFHVIEDERAAVQAELARVKSESLRAVHSGETEARCPRFFLRKGGWIVWQRIGEPDRFGNISAFDVRDTDKRCCIPALEKVMGIRLECWAAVHGEEQGEREVS